jgi:hypothetical protein
LELEPSLAGAALDDGSVLSVAATPWARLSRAMNKNPVE